jgi:hypothetical protein
MARSKSKNDGPGPDSLRTELLAAGDRGELLARIARLEAEIDALKLTPRDRELIELGRGEKKNFAQRFSTSLAMKIANALRPRFSGIQPSADGKGHESLSRSKSGLKKIDVNYSTQQGGLELAISIKTMNFKDEDTGRYTKNTRRIDGELRAEAEDVHHRQPYAVVAGYLFLPWECAYDGRDVSSLKHNAQVLDARSGRAELKNDLTRAELAYVVLYKDDGENVVFRPEAAPNAGIPAMTMTITQSLEEVVDFHRRRNRRK